MSAKALLTGIGNILTVENISDNLHVDREVEVGIGIVISTRRYAHNVATVIDECAAAETVGYGSVDLKLTLILAHGRNSAMGVRHVQDTVAGSRIADRGNLVAAGRTVLADGEVRESLLGILVYIDIEDGIVRSRTIVLSLEIGRASCRERV